MSRSGTGQGLAQTEPWRSQLCPGGISYILVSAGRPPADRLALSSPQKRIFNIAAAARQYRTSPPAKLNVFLEILGRRDDGFHELDTVMVAIDWRDELQLQLTKAAGISLQVDWLPDRQTVAEQLGVAVDDSLLAIPTGPSNLVHRALEMVNEATGYRGGWDVRLGKRIPSGAGMGGASSDAAATLRLAERALRDAEPDLAALLSEERLRSMAADLGSDVPFFLGNTPQPRDLESTANSPPSSAGCLARALGRGERLTFHDLPRRHQFIVVYPAVALSTAAVYAHATVSPNPKSGLETVRRFIRPNPNTVDGILYNALARPARGLSSRIGEALECLRKSRPDVASSQPCRELCQMTGSGSACFVWLAHQDSAEDSAAAEMREDAATAIAARVATIRDSLSGGALVEAVATCAAASEILIV